MFINEVKSGLSSFCGIDLSSITEDSVLVECGMDSVRLLEMCCALEDQYDIELENEDLVPIRTVKEMADLIRAKVTNNM